MVVSVCLPLSKALKGINHFEQLFHSLDLTKMHVYVYKLYSVYVFSQFSICKNGQINCTVSICLLMHYQITLNI